MKAQINRIKLIFVKGLYNPTILSKKQIEECKKLNEENNKGVQEVLKKKSVILVFHDSSFRKPPIEITNKSGKKIIFPPVPFKEIKNSISGSPSLKLHNYLIKNKKIKKDWASLLIGF